MALHDAPALARALQTLAFRGWRKVECVCEQDKFVIAGRIRSYLEAHGGGDSLPGILAWWLLRQRYEESAERVREAVEYLQQQGEIVRREGVDGTVRYFAGTPK